MATKGLVLTKVFLRRYNIPDINVSVGSYFQSIPYGV